MKTKTALLVFALIAPALSAAQGGNTKGGTITFQGRVVAQMTYQATVNGQSHGIVQLPVVKTANISSANDSTPFTVSLKRQAQETGAVNAGLVSHHATARGNLKNVAKGENAAQDVQVQLIDQNHGGKPVRLNTQASSNQILAASYPDDSAQTFAVRYVAEHGTAKTGAVTAIVEYAVNYL